MNIAVIPARGGSKRIPRKNIKLFSGKPMIDYSTMFWYLPTMKKLQLLPKHVVQKRLL